MSGEDRSPADVAEHARLQKALRESVILRELADILNSSLDLEHILLELVKRTTELCEVIRCAVWLLDETGKSFRPITYHVASPSLAEEIIQKAGTICYRTPFPADNPVIRRLLRADGMLYIEDLRTEPTVQVFAETFQTYSVLLIVLAREGRPVGMISLDNPGQIGSFSPAQHQLARAISQQATIAIDNARLYQQAQAQQLRAEHLITRARAIYQVAMAVNSGEELPVVLRLATRHLVRDLESSGGLIMLLDSDETTLRPVDQQEVGYSLPAASISLEDLPNFANAIATGHPLLISAELAREEEVAWLQQFDLKSMLLVPLLVGTDHPGANWDLSEQKSILPGIVETVPLPDAHCVGLIVVNYTRRRKPSSGQYAFAQDIAAQCALAIEKARLLDAAQRSAALANERANTLDAVFQAMTEGITVLTPDGQVLIRNHAAAQFLSVPLHSSARLETFLQQHPAFTLDGRPLSYEEFPLTRALSEAVQVQRERLLLTRGDGSRRAIEITATPLKDSNQQQIGLVSAFRDITVQIQAEQSIHREQVRWQQEALTARASEAAMREADELKNEFLAITAHEFRNPLTVIQGRSQSALRLLHKASQAPENVSTPSGVEENLGLIAAQAKQLNNIVTTFLDAARLNQGQIRLQKETVDLEKIVRQVIEDQAHLVEHHELRCIVSPNKAPNLVQGDPARLAQIVANLVENAIKYSPAGSPVTVTLSQRTPEHTPALLEVCIEDRGMGITPAAQIRLFERFYRVPNAGSETRGVGLGLYIVAQLVQMHEGAIHVESSGVFGEGSRFLFTLPLLNIPLEPPRTEQEGFSPAT